MEQRKLRLIDADTGELVEQDERDDQIEGLKHDIATARGTITRMKRELAELRGIDPEHEEIREVLLYCNEASGRNFHITPASEGWEKVRARLRDKLEDRGGKPFTKAELKLAYDGALLDPWMSGRDRRSKKGGYLAPKHVYKSPDKVQELITLAIGFEAKATIGVGELLEVADQLAYVDWRNLLRVCMCDHRRVEHSKADPSDGRERCLTPGCECQDFDLDIFDPFNQRIDPHLQRWASESP